MATGNERGSEVIEMGLGIKAGGSGSDEGSEKLGNQSQEHDESKHLTRSTKDGGTDRVADTVLLLIEYADRAEARNRKVVIENTAQERSDMGNSQQIRTPMQDCTNDLSIGRGSAEGGYSTGTKGQWKRKARMKGIDAQTNNLQTAIGMEKMTRKRDWMALKETPEGTQELQPVKKCKGLTAGEGSILSEVEEPAGTGPKFINETYLLEL